MASDPTGPSPQSGSSQLQQDVPLNLGLGLRQLVLEYDRMKSADPRGIVSYDSVRALVGHYPDAVIDLENRVLVDIYLDGSKSILDFKSDLKVVGIEVLAEADWYRYGVLSAYVPIRDVASVGRLRGVSAIHRALRAHTNLGSVTSEGVSVHKTDLVGNLGYKGAGVTVGVLSDSFDANRDANGKQGTTIHASDDVVSGDLPGSGNPDGYTFPVNTLKELPMDQWPGTDEGRAMCQIVHDVAPAAKIAFATGVVGEVDFAAQMQALKDGAGCKVIVDDVTYLDEPFFSDGLLGQKVDSLAASGVAYFSAAGNAGNAGYLADFHYLSNAQGRQAATAAGLNLATFVGNDSAGNPTVNLTPYTSGGWHNFTPYRSTPSVVQQYLDIVGLWFVILQWDDPFDIPGGITTEYNFFVFDGDGNYHDELSSYGGAFATNKPLRLPPNYLDPFVVYQIVITKSGQTNGDLAKHLWLRYSNGTVNPPVLLDPPADPNAPTAFGHGHAAGGIGVAAYVFDNESPPRSSNNPPFQPAVESFSSGGPATIYFDANGNRLAVPQTRQQPGIAAVDGVDNTFFPSLNELNDANGDGFPNFYGSSAAAPHAAAVAALLINAATANNRPALSSQEIRYLLQSTTQGSFTEMKGVASTGNTQVAFTAQGSDTFSTERFSVTLNGPAGQQLTQLSINLAPVNQVWNEDPDTYYIPFTQGYTTGPAMLQVDPQPVLTNPDNYPHTGSNALLLFSNFTSNQTLYFGADNNIRNAGEGGDDTSELGGAVFSATGSGWASPLTGTLNQVSYKGYNSKAGYGLIDANAAIQKLLGNNSGFQQWQMSHFTPAQASDPNIGGFNADPDHDGIPNGLEYLYNTNPLAGMSSSDAAALPHPAVESAGGVQYLTLTFRQNIQESGLNVRVQVSSNLAAGSWQSVTPDVTENLGPDPVTGDPILRVKINVTHQNRMFVRLQVARP